MSYQLIDATSTGKFVNTLYGSKSKEAPQLVDTSSSGALGNSLTESNLGKPPEGVDADFTVVRPEGKKNLEREPFVQKLMAKYENYTVDDAVNDLKKKLPVNVDGFGDLFDDGTISYENAENVLDRMSDSLPNTMQEGLDDFTFQNMVREVKAMDRELSSSGCSNAAKVKTDKVLGGNSDDALSVGYIISTIASSVIDNLCMEVLGGIDILGNALGLDESMIKSAKKKTAQAITKYGGKSQVKALVDDLGIDEFLPPERVAMATGLVDNYQKRPSVGPIDYESEAKDLVSFVGELNPSWDKKILSTGVEVLDLNELGNSSEDFNAMLLNDPVKSASAAFAGSGLMDRIEI